MGKREERRAAKRQLMLDTAMAIVNEQGLESLTIARLAGRIDAAVGALYRYFDSKEALIAELEKEYIDVFRLSMEADLEHAQSAIAEAGYAPGLGALLEVLVAFHAYLLDATREPERHQLIDTFLSAPTPVLSDEQAAELELTHIGKVIGICAERLENAVAAGALAPGHATVRTFVLWAGLHGLDHFRKRDRIQPEELRTPSIAQALYQSVLLGWGADPELVREALSLLPEITRPV